MYNYTFKNIIRIIVATFASFLFLASCNKDQSQDNEPDFTLTTGNVIKVTPKQALIEFSIRIPEEIGYVNCEAGITYTLSPAITPGLNTLAPIEDLSSSSISAKIKLIHLDSGATYHYATYVKYNDKVYIGEVKTFRTEDLPEHAVDLGLPDDTLWADSCIGADSPKSSGKYYRWGETEPTIAFQTSDIDYHSSNYKFYSESKDIDGSPLIILSKYTRDDGVYAIDTWRHYSWYDYSNNFKFIGDNKTVLEPEDDVVSNTMGGNWRMPTISDYITLLNGTTWYETYTGSTRIQRFKGSNGNEIIFYPADDNTPAYVESSYVCWTSNLWFDDGVDIPEQYEPILISRYMESRFAVYFSIIPDGYTQSNTSGQLVKHLVFGLQNRSVPLNVRGVYPCDIEDDNL